MTAARPARSAYGSARKLSPSPEANARNRRSSRAAFSLPKPQLPRQGLEPGRAQRRREPLDRREVVRERRLVGERRELGVGGNREPARRGGFCERRFGWPL